MYHDSNKVHNNYDQLSKLKISKLIHKIVTHSKTNIKQPGVLYKILVLAVYDCIKSTREQHTTLL